MKKYTISNLDCPNCAAKLEQALLATAGVKEVSINYPASCMYIDTRDMEKVHTTIKEVEPGVRISEVDSKADENSVPLSRKLELLISSLLFTGGFFAAHFLGDGVAWFFFVPAYLLSGYMVIFKAFRNLFKGRVFDENFLMALATIGAIVIREPAEAAGVMVFYKIGTLLQEISVNRSRRSIKSLLELRPLSALVITAEGDCNMPPDMVKPGDLIRVVPGEKVPLDGVIRKGSSRVDTSALTGEPAARNLEEGEEILGGMINQTHMLEIEVTRSFKDSSVNRILELVEKGLSKKARVEKFITRFAKIYTPLVVILAFGVAVFLPLFTDMVFGESIHRALVLLVISCPCALMLSIPLGYFVSLGRASKEGMLVKGASFMDTLTGIKSVIFDKTGTLTEGRFKVQELRPAPGYNTEELLTLALTAESHSNHPIAHSIREFSGEKFSKVDFDSYKELSGYGIISQWKGSELLAVNHAYLHKEGIDHICEEIPGTVVHIVLDRSYRGSLILGDKIKEDAYGIVDDLKDLGIEETVILTGDSPSTAEDVRKALGIKTAYSSLLPEDKMKHLEEIMASHSPVVFMGDGINDSPVIARADIGVAMGQTGADAAVDVADMVLMSPSRIVKAVKLARKTKEIITGNIVFTLGIKVLFIAFGIAGQAGMWAAVFADIGVSLIAVLNSMRLRGVKL